MTVQEKYKKITSTLIQDHLKISTMESCTAGFIASLITDTEGASAIFEGSYITYANRTKIQCGVPSAVLEEHGVYSKETAAAMAKCCLQGFSADRCNRLLWQCRPFQSGFRSGRGLLCNRNKKGDQDRICPSRSPSKPLCLQNGYGRKNR